MLVVKRSTGEEIIIGDPEKPLGKVVIYKIKGGIVTVGVDLPKGLGVWRKEVADQKLAKK